MTRPKGFLVMRGWVKWQRGEAPTCACCPVLMALPRGLQQVIAARPAPASLLRHSARMQKCCNTVDARIFIKTLFSTVMNKKIQQHPRLCPTPTACTDAPGATPLLSPPRHNHRPMGQPRADTPSKHTLFFPSSTPFWDAAVGNGSRRRCSITGHCHSQKELPKVSSSLDSFPSDTNPENNMPHS